jgi:hypothetical protein
MLACKGIYDSYEAKEHSFYHITFYFITPSLQ